MISLSKILTKKEKKKLFNINNIKKNGEKNNSNLSSLKEREPIIEINSKEINDKYDSTVIEIEINNDLNNNNKEEETKQNLNGDERGKENINPMFYSSEIKKLKAINRGKDKEKLENIETFRSYGKQYNTVASTSNFCIYTSISFARKLYILSLSGRINLKF